MPKAYREDVFVCASGRQGQDTPKRGKMKHQKKLITCSIGAVLAIVSTQYEGELKTSEEGLKLISGYENCTLNAYKCPAGKWTNGIGNTHGVNPDGVISLNEVAYNFVSNVKEAEACVSKNSKFKLTQGKWDAATGFTMNAGCGNYKKSSYAKTGDCSKLLLWNKYKDPATGKLVVSKGLDNRRKSEYSLCVKN